MPLNHLTCCGWTQRMFSDETLSWNAVEISHCHVRRGNAVASFSHLVATRFWTKVSIMNSDLLIFISTKHPKNLVTYFGPSYVREKNWTIWIKHASTVFMFFALFFFKYSEPSSCAFPNFLTFPNVTSNTVKASFWNNLLILKKTAGRELSTFKKSSRFRWQRRHRRCPQNAKKV